MSRRTKGWIFAFAVLTAVGLVALSWFVLVPPAPSASRPGGPQVPTFAGAAGAVPATQRPKTSQEVAEQYAGAWNLADTEAAAALTTEPQPAGLLFAGLVGAVRPGALTAALSGPVLESGETAAGRVAFTWSLDSDRVWAYTADLPMVRTADRGWLARWSPALAHPMLAEGWKVAWAGSGPDLVDQGGTPLVVGGEAVEDLGSVLGPALTRPDVLPSGAQRLVLLDHAGTEQAELVAAPPGDGDPRQSTVDIEVQRAAQRAVDTQGRPAFLVAIDAGTGGVLAVAQNAAAGGAPLALNGLYPPGSVFKIATSAALLDSGTAPETVLPCPGQTTVGARAIRNAGFDLGSVPLRQAFARSCNTTFARAAAELPSGALPAAAAQFGLAADFTLPGLTTQTGRVVPATSGAEQVENAIGQGTVQVSPFGAALMAATVARGGAVTPSIFTDLPTEVTRGYQGPSGTTVAALQSFMRTTVTNGTATALARHGVVAGKTGTAERGGGQPDHAWFAGYRGDVAFAVLVDGGGGSQVAVDVAGKFLQGV